VLLTKVDRLILASQKHWHLDPGDDCYFFGEYTARQRYDFSEVNQFILNFKKSMDRKCVPLEWRHKETAIWRASEILAEGLATPNNIEALRAATLVPVPPSNLPGDPLYDDRILRMLSGLNARVGGLDIRQLVTQRYAYPASHSTESRATPEQLGANYVIDESLSNPVPRSIWIFDDLLVSGSHYRAMVQTLRLRFTNAAFVGIFLARRITIE
jgi:hypothetical protein